LVAIFSRWRMKGVCFVTPNAETAHKVLSKRETYAALRGSVPVPKCFESFEDMPFPAFAKPDRSSGSKDIHLIENEAEAAAAFKKGLLVCEYLPGREYTVDCLNDLRGNLLVAHPRLRGRTGMGIALSSRHYGGGALVEHCRRIANALRIEGPWFAQFKEDNEGRPKLLEVNTRVAGSSGFTRLSGANLPLISVFMYMGHPVRVPQIKPQLLVNRCLYSQVEGVMFDWVIWDLDDTLVRKDGKADPDSVACLIDCHNRGKRQLLVTKNAAPKETMQRLGIPDLFEAVVQTGRKVDATLAAIETHHIDIDACIVVNDSYTELFELQERAPRLRTVTPDALSVLGREGLA
jgi:predicted HAD superfamily phosphohydrolase YqeG